MRIHTRFLLFLLVSIVLYAIALQTLRHAAERVSASMLEVELQETAGHINEIIALERAPMEKGIFDNTFWDEMVAFVRDPSPEWAQNNIEESFPRFGFELIWVYDADLGLVYTMPSKAGDPAEPALNPTALRQAFANGWFRHFYGPGAGGTPIEYFTAPIQPSADQERTSPPQGFLVGGRRLGRPYLDRLASITGSVVAVKPLPAGGEARNSADQAKGIIEIQAPLTDQSETLLALLSARHRNSSLQLLRNALDRFNWLFLAFALLNLAVLTALVSMWVTTPLKRVSDALDRSELAPVARYLDAKHEFGTLARLIRNFFEQRQALVGEIEMRKQYESHLREARDQAHGSAKAKADFLAVISHELRTPLNAVIGLAALLIEQQPRPDQVEHLETLKFSAENLLGLINDVLDFNKLDSGGLALDRREVDLRALTAGVLRSFAPQARAKGLSLTSTLPPDLPARVMTDPLRLSQVLGNLLSNAVKFTDAGGVTLAVTASGESEERVRVAFRVSDTGIGIPADQQAHIFELFTQADSDPTRRFGGTGLGLTIVKRLVELMGGGIVVDSVPGRGATFRFILDLDRAPAPAPDAAAEAEPPPADLHGQRILVVEDNPINRQLAVTFLRKWGAEVDTAEQGAAAVAMAAKRPYDLILMDLQMPEMSGVEAAERIRQQAGGPNLRTPILAFTATTPAGEPADLEAFGFDGYIAKPVDPAHLRAAIARHLDVAPQRRARG